MLNFTLTQKLAILASTIVYSLTAYRPIQSATFEQQEVNQSQIIAIARPYGDNKYDLLVIEQIPGQRQCWSESGANPVVVQPLLLNFDFTGSCERSTDSNGYSIRISGQDYGMDYLLRILQSDGELLLVGTPRKNGSQKDILIGRTQGMSQGFLKFSLEPGWRFSKRAYQGRVLKHVYFTGDNVAIDSPANPPLATTNPSTSPNLQPTEPPTVREFTFTAGSSNSSLPPLPNNKKEINSLPPPPLPSASTPLPPPPPPNQPASQVNTNRKSLSDVLAVKPRNFDANGNPIVDNNWTPATPPTPQPVASRGYRVLVVAQTKSQQTQLRALFPESFPTSYNGRALWQIGLFSNQENAQQALGSIKNAGLDGVILQ